MAEETEFGEDYEFPKEVHNMLLAVSNRTFPLTRSASEGMR